MRMIENTLASNLSLFGKTTRRYLTTTALTAASIIAITSPAFADNWTDHVASEGSISIDTSVANTTNITQGTDFAKVHGDGDINAGWTVNVAQPSSKAKYVLYDTEADPTKIMGVLNANGRVYIFDRNGVIFGEGSQVNVGSIIASTGMISDENLQNDKLVFENVGGGGKIANYGTISVGEAGLAAFVAPTVINNGVINAKMGNVVMASGEKVTLDFYGDNLVEVAVEGELSDALIRNKGTIKAEGGKVFLTAAAAKGAVDNVINMKGIIDVSSVSVKGGKIILSGGSKGAVSVSGELNASGASGGDITVTGQNVDVTETAEITADAAVDGNGGNVLVYGHDYAIFRGRLSARGGASSGNGGNAEISGGESVGYYGFSDLSADNGTTGTLLIDPKILNIGNGSLITTLADAIADIIAGGTGTIHVDDQSLANTLRFSNVNLWATETINTTSEVDISTWNGLFGSQGITSRNLTLAAPVINILHDVILGNGKLNLRDLPGGSSVLGFGIINVPAGGVQVDKLNLDGTIYTRSSVGGTLSEAGDSQLNSDVHRVNVLSDSARIQQAIYLADDAGGATVRVAPGRYHESITVSKSVNLSGANVGVDPTTTSPRGPESIILPNSPGFHVTADNVSINGFTINGADRGIFVDGADNILLRNNIIRNSSENGIHIFQSDNIDVRNNRIIRSGLDAIYGAFVTAGDFISNRVRITLGGDGIALNNSSDINILENRVIDIRGNGISVASSGGSIRVNENFIGSRSGLTPITYIDGNGILIQDVTTGADVKGNVVRFTRSTGGSDANGIYILNSSLVRVGGTVPGTGNRIGAAGGNGIYVSGGANNKVLDNFVIRSKGAGIYGDSTDALHVYDNTVINSNLVGYGAITVLGGGTHRIGDNTIFDRTGSKGDAGVHIGNVSGRSVVHNNTISDINGNGIVVHDGFNVVVRDNTVENSELRGLYVSGPNQRRTAVRGNTFTNNPIGAEFESGRVALNGNSNIFNGGQIGMRFAPFDLGGGVYAPLSLRDADGNPDSIFPATPTNYGGSIFEQVFNGQSLYYIELANNAFFKGGVPMWIDGTNSTYDGITPSLTGGVLSQADFDAIEGKLFHYIDQPNLGIFWFGFVEPPVTTTPPELALIAQEDIFNVFGAFNGDVTGLNVRITGLPRIPGAPNAAGALNSIQTFAGNNTNPSNLNEIETAAGEGAQGNPSVTEVAQNPADIEPASGGSETQCWGDAMTMAGSGQAVNVVYQGTMADSLNQAAACGTSF